VENISFIGKDSGCGGGDPKIERALEKSYAPLIDMSAFQKQVYHGDTEGTEGNFL
jgi:hypothetical protein